MLPHKVTLVERIGKSKIGFSSPQGSSKFMFIKILRAFSDDVGLYAHEYEHVKQWYMFFGIGLAACVALYFLGFTSAAVILAPSTVALKGLLYTFVRPARKWMEVQAFREQIRHYRDEDHLEFFSKSLSENYNLKITKEEALRLLLK